jgi:hypothetical protein
MKYPHTENQGESFDNPKNSVKDFFVAGYSLVVGDVLEELQHPSIFSWNGRAIEWTGYREGRRRTTPALPSGVVRVKEPRSGALFRTGSDFMGVGGTSNTYS